MSRVEVRDLGQPEAVVHRLLGATSPVRLAQTVISCYVLQPGWSWKEHDPLRRQRALRPLRLRDEWERRREAALGYARRFDWNVLLGDLLAKLGLTP